MEVFGQEGETFPIDVNQIGIRIQKKRMESLIRKARKKPAKTYHTVYCQRGCDQFSQTDHRTQRKK